MTLLAPEALSPMTALTSGVPVLVLMKTSSLPAPATSLAVPVPVMTDCPVDPKRTPPVLTVVSPLLLIFSVWAVLLFIRMLFTVVPAVAVNPVVTSAFPLKVAASVEVCRALKAAGGCVDTDLMRVPMMGLDRSVESVFDHCRLSLGEVLAQDPTVELRRREVRSLRILQRPDDRNPADVDRLSVEV